LFDEAAGAVLDRVAAGEPVRSELAEGDVVAGDVVVGDEDVVAGGADRFLLAAAAADLPVAGGEVGLLGARSGAGASLSAARSQWSPWRVLPERRLPPDWSVPGQMPAQETRRSALGKTLMSMPHSSISTS